MPDKHVADGGRVVWHLVPPLQHTGPDWLVPSRVYDRGGGFARAASGRQRATRAHVEAFVASLAASYVG